MIVDDKARELTKRLALQQAAMDVLLRAVAEAHEALEMANHYHMAESEGVATKLTSEGIRDETRRAASRLWRTAKVACAATGWDYQRAVTRERPEVLIAREKRRSA